MSYKIEAVADATGEIVPLGFRFATEKEAEAYGAALFGLWKNCKTRVLHSTEPVNYPPSEDDDDNDD